MNNITIDIDPNVKKRIEDMAKDINDFVTAGKWEVFNKDVDYLLSKYELNELLMMGCKQVQSYGTMYFELPYDGLDDSQVTAIMIKWKAIEDALKGAE